MNHLRSAADRDRPVERARVLWRRYRRWWAVPYQDWSARRRRWSWTYAVAFSLAWALVLNLFVLH